MLEHVREGPEEVDDALRHRGIEVVIRPQEDRLRGLVPSHADRHSASDIDLASFVAGRHHDAAASAALGIRADDHRLADQVRILPPLHADIEGVHIYVENDAGHGPGTAGSLISLVPSGQSARTGSGDETGRHFTGRRTRCPRGPA